MFAAGIMWFLVLVFRSIDEPVDPEATVAPKQPGKDTWDLFTENRAFRNFVIVRSLMLVSALSTAFMVTLSQEVGSDITGLGLFLVASGLSALIGGRFSGKLADKSSKNAMSIGAAVSSAIILVTLVAVHLGPDEVAPWILPTAFFALNLAHITIRVARKTYIVDIESDVRTRYVGAANTLMGVILIVGRSPCDRNGGRFGCTHTFAAVAWSACSRVAPAQVSSDVNPPARGLTARVLLVEISKAKVVQPNARPLLFYQRQARSAQHSYCRRNLVPSPVSS